MTKLWLFVGKDESVDGAWEVRLEALTVREGARWGERGGLRCVWELRLYTHCRL